MPIKKESPSKRRPLESSFRTRVNKKLDEIPGLFHFSLMAVSILGLPDKVACYRGRFIAWELKRSMKDATKERKGHALQRWTLQKISECGGIARIVYPENFKECLEELLRLE